MENNNYFSSSKTNSKTNNKTNSKTNNITSSKTSISNQIFKNFDFMNQMNNISNFLFNKSNQLYQYQYKYKFSIS